MLKVGDRVEVIGSCLCSICSSPSGSRRVGTITCFKGFKTFKVAFLDDTSDSFLMSRLKKICKETLNNYRII